MLVERDNELANLENLLRTGAGRCRIALVSGAVGTGKTELLDTFLEHAAARDAFTLSVSGRPVEYAVGLEQLLHQAAAIWAEQAPDTPETPSAPDGLDLPELPDVPEAAQHRYRLLNQLAGRLAGISTRRPVVIAVDDVDAADPSCVTGLVHLARRLRSANVLFVLTASDHEQDPLWRVELLRLPGSRLIPLAPFTAGGVERVLAPHLGERAAAARATAFHELSGGNPLLLNALIHDDARHPAAEPRRGEPAVGDLFHEAVLTCLQRVGPYTARVARAAAVLDRTDLAGRLARLCAAEAGRAVAELTAIGLVRAGGVRNRQTREAILWSIPAEERRALRMNAARLLHEAGAPETEVAAHLLEARPEDEPWVAATLLAAGRQMLRADRVDAAIRFLEAAARAARWDHERLAATLLLAQARCRSSPLSAAPQLAPLLAALCDGRLDRRHAPFVLRLLLWHGRLAEAGTVLRSTVGQEEADQDRPGRAPALAPADWARAYCPDLLDPRSAPAGGRPGRSVRRPTRLQGRATGLLSEVLTAGGDARSGELAELVLRGAVLDDDSLESIEAALLALIYSDRADRAVPWCEKLLAEADRRRAPAWQAVLGALRGEAALRLGDPTAAQDYCRAAFAQLPPRNWGVAVGGPLGTLVLALGATGRYEEAENWLAQPVPERMFQTRYGLHYRYARGQLCLETKRLYTALEDFTACGDLMERWGIDTPALVPWRTATASVLVHLGEGAQARRLAQEQLSLPGARRLRTRGFSLRVLAKTSVLEERPQLLQKAAACLQSAGDRLELARTVAELALTRRALGQIPSADKLLGQATRLAEECNALPLRKALLEVFAPAAERPADAERRGDSSLTDAERRVASLAARGLTNREIAQRLRITVSTVEQHLTRVYRKLCITSRNDLARSVGKQLRATSAA